jgi:iron complex outermembrane recepter protein
MDDQGAISIQDALVGNVSSVFQNGQGYGGAEPVFNIRGFDNGTNSGGMVYYNGPQTSGIDPNLSNVQSFQVLKGPSSVRFGRMQPGGLIWLQLKRPQETPYCSIEEQAGDFGTTRTTIDATGPLTDDKTWLYRFNANVENINSFVDFVYSKNLSLVPAVTTTRSSNSLCFSRELTKRTSMLGIRATMSSSTAGTRPRLGPAGAALSGLQMILALRN